MLLLLAIAGAESHSTSHIPPRSLAMKTESLLLAFTLLLALLLAARVPAADAAGDRLLRGIQIKPREAKEAKAGIAAGEVLFECCCVSTTPYVQHEEKTTLRAAAIDVRKGHVPSCPQSGNFAPCSSYGDTGCKVADMD